MLRLASGLVGSLSGSTTTRGCSTGLTETFGSTLGGGAIGLAGCATAWGCSDLGCSFTGLLEHPAIRQAIARIKVSLLIDRSSISMSVQIYRPNWTALSACLGKIVSLFLAKLRLEFPERPRGSMVASDLSDA